MFAHRTTAKIAVIRTFLETSQEGIAWRYAQRFMTVAECAELKVEMMMLSAHMHLQKIGMTRFPRVLDRKVEDISVDQRRLVSMECMSGIGSQQDGAH